MSIFHYLFVFGVTYFTVMRTDGPMLPPSTCALRQTTHPLPFGMCDHEVPFTETRTWRQLSAAPCLLFSLSTTCPQICTSMFAMSRSRGQNLYKAEAVHQDCRCMPLPLEHQGCRCMPLPLVSMGSDELNSGPHAVWQALYPLSHPLSSTAPHILICPGSGIGCIDAGLCKPAMIFSLC